MASSPLNKPKEDGAILLVSAYEPLNTGDYFLGGLRCIEIGRDLVDPLGIDRDQCMPPLQLQWLRRRGMDAIKEAVNAASTTSLFSSFPRDRFVACVRSNERQLARLAWEQGAFVTITGVRFKGV